jgi:hypothetical protein
MIDMIEMSDSLLALAEGAPFPAQSLGEGLVSLKYSWGQLDNKFLREYAFLVAAGPG